MKVRGIVTLEFLSAFIFGLLILSTIVPVLRNTGRDLNRLRGMERQITAELSMHQLLWQVADDMDRHPLPITPILHHNGSIKYTDGVFQLTSKNPDLLPAADSDAITYIEAELKLTQTIDGLKPDGTEYVTSACPLFTQDTITDENKNFLALSPDGWTELTGADTGPSDLPLTCDSLRFKMPEKSMVGTQKPDYLENSRMLMPLRAIYTLYRDASGTLRHMSHRGTDITENQPILENVTSFTLTFSYDPQIKLSEIVYSDGRNFNPPVLNKLPRISLQQFLLLRVF